MTIINWMMKIMPGNIRTKLIGGFLVLNVLILVVFGVNYLGMNKVAGALDQLSLAARQTALVKDTQLGLAQEWQYYTDYSLSGNKESLNQARVMAVDIRNNIKELQNLLSSESAKNLDAFLVKHQTFVEDGEMMAIDYLAGDKANADQLMQNFDSDGDGLVRLLGDLSESLNQASTGLQAKAKASQNSANLWGIVIQVFALMVGLGLSTVLSQYISRGVEAISKGLERISKGDLNATVSIDSHDEIGQMSKSYGEMRKYILDMAKAAEKIASGDLRASVETREGHDTLGLAFTQMNLSLRELLGKVNTIAADLSSASEQLTKAAEQAGQATQQIATTSQQVARGASEQSNSLQQTNQGIEQLSKAIQQINEGAQKQAKSIEKNVEIVNQVSSAVKGVSDNAQEAAEGANQAGDAAGKGAAMAKRTVEGMGKIKGTMDVASKRVTDLGQRSNEIGKIVATIDDIAAQTNLLALNAAIEAARAGEQGRGFAVVADEVRKLAERSSGATKEIADLIASIQGGVNEAVQAMKEGNKEVDEGYKLAMDAGESLADILRTVQGVSSQVSKISNAAAGLTSLSADMVKVTDGVSSVVEENTAATEQMSASADEVTKSIETVAGVSEENSAATEEVSASTEQMSAQVEQMVASAQSLAQLSRKLKDSVSVFKLN